ncbi:MAG: transposase [Lewinellaceae bacterium]|nr:transposase [Lewinellaceae bacterium]
MKQKTSEAMRPIVEAYAHYPGSKKAFCAEEKEGPCVVIAEQPSRFIDKCIADESLLRVIIADKYLDHLPLYRIGARFERLGMVIPRSTMCGWVGQSAGRLTILHQKLIELVLAAAYLQVDGLPRTRSVREFSGIIYYSFT